MYMYMYGFEGAGTFADPLPVFRAYPTYINVGNPEQDPDALCLDGRFNHHLQLQNRLDFIRYDQEHVQPWYDINTLSNLCGREDIVMCLSRVRFDVVAACLYTMF